MRSRAAFISPQIAFAVPTLTCNITACGRPVIEMGAVRHADGEILVRCEDGLAGTAGRSVCSRPYASASGAKSVPALKKSRSMPRERSAAR